MFLISSYGDVHENKRPFALCQFDTNGRMVNMCMKHYPGHMVCLCGCFYI